MLDGVSVTNFKSLRQVSLSFPRLTLLLGPNSSGKSSVFQVLLAIKQTFESRNVFVPLVLGGRYTQLGSFENVVYGRHLSEKLTVEVKVRIPPRFRIGRSRSLDSFITSREIDLSAVTIRFTLGYVKSTRRIKLSETHVRDAKDLEIIAIKEGKITRLLGKDTEYQISGRRVKIGSAKFVVALTYFLPHIFSERYLAPRDPDARSLLNVQTIISNLRFILENQFTRNLLYLGPLREYPKRYYFATGEVPRDVGLKGENVVELLYYDAKVRKRKADRTINLLKPWLEKFGLAKDVRIEALPEGLYSLTLQDPHTTFEIDMSDTGFGVSQVLPVVVECLSAPQDSTVLIEQPEIHVHPKVQADLADLFITACRERKIIVETHSEHILLRIQRRIAEGELSPNDVAAYYFDPTHEGTQVSRLSFDESGSLKNWPVGFFEEDYQEALARQKALLGKNAVAES